MVDDVVDVKESEGFVAQFGQIRVEREVREVERRFSTTDIRLVQVISKISDVWMRGREDVDEIARSATEIKEPCITESLMKLVGPLDFFNKHPPFPQLGILLGNVVVHRIFH